MIIYNNIIPFKGYIAMNIFGIIFARKKLKSKPALQQCITINHEQIHTKQYLETLFILFLIWYVIEYVVKLCITRSTNRAYKSISFEQEAYRNETNLNYLYQRKHYKWLVYVCKLV